MRPHATLAILVILSAPLVASEAPARDYAPLPEHRVFGTSASDADAEAIEDLMDRFSAAWNHQDLEALLPTYADDAEWTNAFGLVQRGHDELRDTFTWVFDRFPATPSDTDAAAAEDTEAAPAKEADSAAEPAFPRRLSLRYLGDDAAVVHSVTESSWGESHDGIGKRRVHIVYILEKRPEGWRIAHQTIMDARR